MEQRHLLWGITTRRHGQEWCGVVAVALVCEAQTVSHRQLSRPRPNSHVPDDGDDGT